MKEQITALMEALRLVSVEIECFKDKRRTRDATLDAIEAIIDDPKVRRAIESIQPLVEAPGLVPEATESSILVR